MRGCETAGCCKCSTEEYIIAANVASAEISKIERRKESNVMKVMQ